MKESDLKNILIEIIENANEKGQIEENGARFPADLKSEYIANALIEKGCRITNFKMLEKAYMINRSRNMVLTVFIRRITFRTNSIEYRVKCGNTDYKVKECELYKTKSEAEETLKAIKGI